MPALLALFLLTAVPSALAAVYKCDGDKGGVVYQDTPCGPGKELRNLQTDPPTLSVVPGTPVAPAKSTAASPKPDRLPRASSKPARQLGNPAERKFVREGMSEGDVLLKLGKPDVAMNARGAKSTQWSYMPTLGDPDTLTTITFAGGKVTRVERKVAR